MKGKKLIMLFVGLAVGVFGIAFSFVSAFVFSLVEGLSKSKSLISLISIFALIGSIVIIIGSFVCLKSLKIGNILMIIGTLPFCILFFAGITSLKYAMLCALIIFLIVSLTVMNICWRQKQIKVG